MAIIISKIAGIPKEFVLTHNDIQIPPAVVKKIRYIIKRRLEHYPLQYLLGTVEFMGMDFFIKPGVLIPRPETELSVEIALKLIERYNYSQVLDLCCGSGVIGLSIACINKSIGVCLTDKSKKAVALARENSVKLDLLPMVRFYTGNLFAALPSEEKFDLIVSNPPYIPHGRISRLSGEVRCEPLSAIDGGEKGVKVVRRIIKQAGRFLDKNGMLIIEHDDTQEDYMKEMCEDRKQIGLKYIKTINDLSGLPRVSVFAA